MQLPLNGRNFLALAQLSDAVVIPPGGTRGEALQQAGPLPNVGGQRSGHNIYLLDGTKVTDELFNNLVINPSVDSIEEFKIQKSMYPAEFGGKASALINVVDASRLERVSRQPLRVPSRRRLRFAELLPAGGPADVRRCGRISSAARSAGRCVQQPLVLLRQLRRAADEAVADAHVLGAAGGRARRRLRGHAAPICDPLTIPTTGVCAPFREQPDPGGPHRPDCRGVAAARAAADVDGAALQNLAAVEEQDRELDQFSVRLDHQLTDVRPAVRALQHLRRRRDPAVRHERAAGNARARVRPVADDQDAEPGREPHARVRAARC